MLIYFSFSCNSSFLLLISVIISFLNLTVQQCIADSTMSSDSDATIVYDSDSKPYFLYEESSYEEQPDANAQVNSNKPYDLLVYF